MRIKNIKFQEILNSSEFADVELILKAKKLPNGKFAITTSYELSLEQLKSMDITLEKKEGSEVMPRESKPPKWASELISTVNSLVTKVDSIEKDVKDMKQDIKEMKNTPTMKRELKSVKQQEV